MGQVGFLVPLREFLPAEAPQRAYVAALDQLPWQTRVTTTATGLLVERSENESGYFHILWNTAARGPLVLITGTIVEREEPYNLPVELARGVICRLRNQVGGWEAAGLTPPPTVIAQLQQALRRFVTAATSQDRPADAAAHAQQAIEAALVGSDLLVDAFAQQAIRVRKGQALKLAILLGGSLGQVPPEKLMTEPFLAAFNAAIVPCTSDASRAASRTPAMGIDRRAACLVREPRRARRRRTAFGSRAGRVAGLALSLGRRFQEYLVGGHRADSDRDDALQGTSPSLELHRAREHRRRAVAIGRRSLAADGASGRNGSQCRSAHAGDGDIRPAVGRLSRTNRARFAAASLRRRFGPLRAWPGGDWVGIELGR